MTSGIYILCATCKKQHRYTHKTQPDVEEPERFQRDCVQDFVNDHPCIVPGARIYIHAFNHKERQ